jgi:hypothetical protein
MDDIKQIRKDFSRGLNKYFTKNDNMKGMPKKDLLNWIFTDYVINHKMEGVKGLLGLTQTYEKGNIFNFSRLQVVGVWNHDIYGTLKGDDLMSPKSTTYVKFYNNNNEINKYK